ncbi:MAG: hypothetical protein AB1810_13275 [Pseudomonadota bacterium]
MPRFPICFALFLFFCLCSMTHAASDLSLSYGKRTDDLRWTIAGDVCGYSPNILSELIWRDIESNEFGVTLSGDLRRDLMFRGSFKYGKVTSGDNQDSDYLYDNRGGEFSRSYSDASDGHVMDLSFAIGTERKTVLPNHTRVGHIMMGFARNTQAMRMRDGVQVIGESISGCIEMWPPGTRYPDLDSRYEAMWTGFFLGGDIAYVKPRIEFRAGAELHAGWYDAEAYWNLRDLYFEHEANSAYGLVLTGGVFFPLRADWRLGLTAEYTRWESGSGKDRIWQSGVYAGQAIFNGAEWTSHKFLLSLEKHL